MHVTESRCGYASRAETDNFLIALSAPHIIRCRLSLTVLNMPDTEIDRNTGEGSQVTPEEDVEMRDAEEEVSVEGLLADTLMLTRISTHRRRNKPVMTKVKVEGRPRRTRKRKKKKNQASGERMTLAAMNGKET